MAGNSLYPLRKSRSSDDLSKPCEQLDCRHCDPPRTRTRRLLRTDVMRWSEFAGSPVFRRTRVLIADIGQDASRSDRDSYGPENQHSRSVLLRAGPSTPTRRVSTVFDAETNLLG